MDAGSEVWAQGLPARPARRLTPAVGRLYIGSDSINSLIFCAPPMISLKG